MWAGLPSPHICIHVLSLISLMASANDNSDNSKLEEDNENKDVEQEEKTAADAAVITTTEELNQLEAKIIRQLEFYFGDRNLVKDKFLQEKIKEDSEGWVGLDVLLTFNRLKTLSTDTAIISEAIKKSKSELLEVNDDGTSIRRVKGNKDMPTVKLLSPEIRKEMKDRTLHLKGFPEDSNFDDIQDFLLQFGETVFIQMRRYSPEHEEKARKFKGSVFVEYKELAAVTKISSQPDDVKYKDNQLIIETKEQFLQRQNLKRKTRSTGGGDDDTIEEPKSKVSKADDDDDTTNDQTVIRKKEAILFFKGCGSDTNREKIKELFNQWSEVAWVDFSMGDTEGYVRFDEDGGAIKVFEAMSKDGTPQICDADTSMRVLEGEEELKFWKKMKSDQIKRRIEKDKKKKGGNRRGGRGWRGGGRGGRFNKRSRDD